MTKPALFALGLVLAVPARAQSPTAADTVRQFFTEFSTQMNRGNYAAVLDCYADDPRFYWIDEHAGRQASRADFVAEFGRLKAAKTPSMTTYARPRVTLLGNDTALLDTKYETVMGTGSSAAKFGGLMTVLMIRTRAGWKILWGRS